MTFTERESKPFKSSLKTLIKKQCSLKTQELPTARISKVSSKNHPSSTSQNLTRTPQMIKLMINQLQKQLLVKEKSKEAFEKCNQELNRTKRKLIKQQKTEFQMKETYPSRNVSWKSDSNKKQNKLSLSSSEKKQIAIKTGAIEKCFSKIKKFKNLVIHGPQFNKKTCQSNEKIKKLKNKSRCAKQNYIFLDDNLLALPTPQLPLFIVENNTQVVDNSQFFSLNDENKSLVIDKKHSLMRHSKNQSFDSMSLKRHRHVNFIERSFCESDISSEENGQNESFFQLNFLNKQNFLNHATYSFPIQDVQKFGSSNDNLQNRSLYDKLDIKRVIEVNNSVLKIQKWWRNSLTCLKQKIEKQQNHGIKQSNQTIERKEESQNNIRESHKKQINEKNYKDYVQPVSVSEKQICAQKAQNHEDILKLRQNAAYLQFQTHQKILKDFLFKNKITSKQYQQKLEQITINLSKQLNEVARAKLILKESAEKIQEIVKKTKNDILIAKKIVCKGQQNDNHDLEFKTIEFQSNSKAFKNSYNYQENDILSTIFGQKQSLLLKNQPNSVHSQEVHHKPIEASRQQKRLKFVTYETQLQEFSNQKSEEEEENSFIDFTNQRVFNSPNGDSQQNLSSPQSQSHQELSSQENLEEDLSACLVQSTAQRSCSAESAPFAITANFQELYQCTYVSYAEYQEQQQIKKQIESRIAKQLGVPEVELSIRNEKQSQTSISTSIVAIHKFLLNFFKFYLYYHKDQFLTLMNMPYGESVEIRLAKNKLKEPEYALQHWTQTSFYTDDDEQIIYGLKNVISQSVLEDFFESYYQQTDIQFTKIEKTNIELEKIHNRAIFQAFNQGLNFFRPYYNIGGAPYLWCTSEKSLTFFCIGEDNIQEVYEKTQMKILKMSSHLCGVIVEIPSQNKVILQSQLKESKQSLQIQSPFKVMDKKEIYQSIDYQKVKNFEEFLQSYTQKFNATYLINLEERLKKKESAQTEEENLEWFGNTFEEHKVSTLLSLTDLIEQIIFREECLILQRIWSQQNDKSQNLHKFFTID